MWFCYFVIKFWLFKGLIRKFLKISFRNHYVRFLSEINFKTLETQVTVLNLGLTLTDTLSVNCQEKSYDYLMTGWIVPIHCKT